MSTVHGLNCKIQSPDIRQIVDEILTRIKKKDGKSYALIQKKVFEILPSQGTDEALFFVDTDINGNCTVSLNPSKPNEGTKRLMYIGKCAHEFGHVVTNPNDVEERCNFLGLLEKTGGRSATNAEAKIWNVWCHELVANNYAYKWGYKQEVELARDGTISDNGNTFLPGDDTLSFMGVPIELDENFMWSLRS